METPDQFTIVVRDLDAGDLRRSWALPKAWLKAQLTDSEVLDVVGDGTVDLYLKKTRGEILVKGIAKAAVVLPCARTLEPMEVPLRSEVFLLLKPLAVGTADSAAAGKRRETVAERPLSVEDAAEDHYSGEVVDLGPFIREHLLLELPLFPVKSDLPSRATAATDTDLAQADRAVDPRLAPLAALASQLRQPKKKEE